LYGAILRVSCQTCEPAQAVVPCLTSKIEGKPKKSATCESVKQMVDSFDMRHNFCTNFLQKALQQPVGAAAARRGVTVLEPHVQIIRTIQNLS